MSTKFTGLIKIAAAVVAVVIVVSLADLGWNWIFCHQWVPNGYSLMMSRKTGEMPREKDRYANPGTGQGERAETGVLENMRGPGRYLDVNPWTYDATQVPDIVVPPGQMYLVKKNVGKDLAPGQFLANPDEKGIQKKVLGPGKWRINPYGETLAIAMTDKNGKIVLKDGKPEIVEATDKNGQILRPPMSAVTVKPGYVGVQTVLGGEKKGVQKTVLPPGIYYVNPCEVLIAQVEVGYMSVEYKVQVDVVEETGKDGVKSRVERPREGTGIWFTLADGKGMGLDITGIGGVFPEDAPAMVSQYGDWAQMESKVIEPQINSICKNAGSNLTTQDFIEGATREKFQEDVTRKIQEVGKEKGIRFLVVLVRGFHPAADIQAAIQAKRIAVEERVTLAVEQDRDMVAADLEQAKRRVDVASSDFDAETVALVQQEKQLGLKKAAEIKAAADRKVADLKKQAAELDAQKTLILGQASADVTEAETKAQATPFQLLVKAFGGPEAYNMAMFAEGLPSDLKLEFRYAGPGTFWTDMKDLSFQGAAAVKLLQPEATAEKQPVSVPKK